MLAYALEFPDAVVRVQLPQLCVCGLAPPRRRFGPLHYAQTRDMFKRRVMVSCSRATRKKGIGGHWTSLVQGVRHG
jgi:hypothetical protein